ncbi:hypothetical protein ACQ4PT_055136 [Festuca glaucescens]
MDPPTSDYPPSPFDPPPRPSSSVAARRPQDSDPVPGCPAAGEVGDAATGAPPPPRIQMLCPAAPTAPTQLPPPPDRLPPNFVPQVVEPSSCSPADAGDKLGWQKVCNRRRPQLNGPPPSPRRVGDVGVMTFRRRMHGRCFRCLDPGHLVAACHGRVRCLSCRRSGHRERDCWQRKKATQASAPVCSGLPAATAPTCSGLPAAGSRRRPLDRSWASIVAPPVVHEDCIHAQPTADAAAASSAIPPDAMLKSVLAEQAKLLRAELQGLATFQLEELVKPVRDVSKSLQGLLNRLGSMLERAAVALEGHSLAPASLQISPMQHALTEVGFATMPNQLEMVVDPVVRSYLEELKELGAPCSGKNLMKEMIEVDAPQELVGQPDVPSTSKELEDTGATCTKKALGIPVVVDDDAVVVMASKTADEAIDGKALGKSDMVGEQCFFGCLFPRASPSPQPDVPVPSECEDIDGIMPVIQIMPDLQELCEDPSPPLSLVHLQVDSLATSEVASAPPPVEACRSGGKYLIYGIN